MQAGVSTACLYPKLLEESLYDLALNGIGHTEIFVNTVRELDKGYVTSLKKTMDHFEVTCRSLHPFTCAMEPMLFFSGYERRIEDGLEFYKKYFQAMNILGAEIFVFHGNKAIVNTPAELYYECFMRLVKTAKEFGVTVAQENVSRCSSGSLDFMKNMVKALGKDAKFVLDTKQAVRAGESSFEILKTLKEHIIHVHISDHGEMGDCLKIGRGSFNIRGFLSTLHECSPGCSVMLELYRSNFEGISDLVGNYNLLSEMIGNIER
jgi:sugar phosphate isomerase/epimerase